MRNLSLDPSCGLNYFARSGIFQDFLLIKQHNAQVSKSEFLLSISLSGFDSWLHPQFHCQIVTILFVDNNFKLEALSLDFHRLLQMPIIGSY